MKDTPSTRPLPLLIAVMSLTAACQQEKPVTLSVASVTALVTPPDARYPSLSLAGNRLLMSWVEERSQKQNAMRFSSTTDGVEFTAPRTIAEGAGWFVNWADFPSITGDDAGNYAAHWLEKNGRGTYSYGVRISCSSNAGQQWTPPAWLHEDRSAAEHGFATLVAEGAGLFTAVWLDGRDQKATGNMTLRSVRFDKTGATRGPESVLDERTCECCATDAAWIDKKGVLAVFRDRGDPEADASEVRDIAVVRQSGAKWTTTAPCHDDGWRNPG